MLLGKIKSDYFKNKKGGGQTWVCAPTFGQNKCSNFAKYLIIFCSLKCKIVNNKKNWLASLANFTILLFSKLSMLYCRPSPLQTFPPEGLQHCRPSPRKICNIADLPPEDLQHCRPSPKGEGLQHCRSSPFHCRSSPGEDLQHCRPSPIFVKFRILIFRYIEIKDFKS